MLNAVGTYTCQQGIMGALSLNLSPLISDTQKDIQLWLDYSISLLHTERHNAALAALERTQSLLLQRRGGSETEKYKRDSLPESTGL